LKVPLTRLADAGKGNVKTLPYCARLWMAEESKPDTALKLEQSSSGD